MSNASRIPVPAPIHLAADPASDGRRFTFAHPAACIPASGTEAAWTATDGKMLAVIPFSIPDESQRGTPGIRIVHRDAVKACKRTKRNPLPFVSVNGAARVEGTDGPEWTAPDGSFPPCADVIPQESQVKAGIVVSLNPELLARLAEALGDSTHVSIVCDPEGKKPMVVIPGKGAAEDAVGLLMPTSAAIDTGKVSIRDEAARRCLKAVGIIRRAEDAKGGAK